MKKEVKSAKARMLIRSSASKVFNAFIDPEITKNFWFTHSSGKLEENKEVEWKWEMYGVSAMVKAVEVKPNEKLSFEWSSMNAEPTLVVMSFKAIEANSTFVSIEHSGFPQEGGDLVDVVADSTGGFNLVLAGLKAYLEHNIRLELVRDNFPEEAR
ncbi:SRPBCC family protein [Christiangramia salexigens]|uniref:Polyketide cyclase n=1 Tax=Christiangramia salexigens TaxID=1913577 RepID=A0A1L3J475_9FLAO|nr:SRPBCC family protein [Christiangramia salexigens]APG59914.1 polyketide cyclase [Christiangramia salexigens]